jgi:2-iminoacetate synthase
VQLLCAFRLLFPDAGLVLSTRESPRMRNGLIRLGVTLMSAGSHTEPGGYTGAGRDHLHQTVRGRIMPGTTPAGQPAPLERRANATEQFAIADARSPREVAEVIRGLGYEPVWKDWEAALTSGEGEARQEDLRAEACF